MYLKRIIEQVLQFMISTYTNDHILDDNPLIRQRVIRLLYLYANNSPQYIQFQHFQFGIEISGLKFSASSNLAKKCWYSKITNGQRFAIHIVWLSFVFYPKKAPLAR